MKAKEWLQKGIETEDPVDKFSNLWRGFNNLYAVENGYPEREKIKSFIIDNIAEDLALEIISECNNDVVYLLSQPVINMRGTGGNTQSDIDSFETAQLGVEKLKAIFIIIYQVRCNLEHGQKSPSRNRDKNLCLHSSNIVTEVLKICT